MLDYEFDDTMPITKHIRVLVEKNEFILIFINR